MNFKYSSDEIGDATEKLYQARCVASLLEGLGDEGDDINYMQLNDLGRLLNQLTDRPLEILNDLRGDSSEDEPEPGEQKPDLVAISGNGDAA